tara:strand:+ start:1879 stop:2523 length:645 start_codon:yes stop_codon:yes gene_type:complete
MDIDGPFVSDPVDLPCTAQELPPAEGKAPVLEEKEQQGKFLGCQGNRFAVEKDLAAGRVDKDVTQLVHATDRLTGCARPSQNGLYPGSQLPGAEGLGDVVVGTQLEADHPVDLVIACGQHDHGNIRFSPNPATALESVNLTREADVQNDKVGGALTDHLKGLFTGGRQVHAVVIAAQVHIDEIGDVRVILDHHYHSLFRHDLSMLARQVACSPA